MQAPPFELRTKCLWIACGYAMTVAATYLGFERSGLQVLEGSYREPIAATMYAYATQENLPDIVILGSSRVEFGMHAGLIEQRLHRRWDREHTVFKLGFGGLRPYLMSAIVRDTLRRMPPNKLLVVGIEERLFTRAVTDRGEWGRAPGGGTLNGTPLPGEWDMDERVANTPELLRGLKNFWYLEWMLRAKTRRMTATARENGGELLSLEERESRDKRLRVPEGSPDRKPYTPRGARWQWDDADSASHAGLGRLLADVAELPVPVVFVALPIRDDLEVELAADRRRFQKEIVARIRGEGFKFYDLGNWNNVVAQDEFLDAHHLTTNGARKVSARIADDVIMRGLLRAEASVDG